LKWNESAKSIADLYHYGSRHLHVPELYYFFQLHIFLVLPTSGIPPQEEPESFPQADFAEIINHPLFQKPYLLLGSKGRMSTEKYPLAMESHGVDAHPFFMIHKLSTRFIKPTRTPEMDHDPSKKIVISYLWSK
jgi:hypothetical protein